MPSKRFLEEAPLYQEQPGIYDAATPLMKLPKVAINMYCTTCESSQTFQMVGDYWKLNEAANALLGTSRLFNLTYACMHCGGLGVRSFSILVNGVRKTMQKVGQYPAWDISGNKDIEKRLGEFAPLYRRGLICESQSYGIAAFAYYRRIVEEIIDGLLNDISGMLSGDDAAKYQEALEQTKKTRVAQEKIAVVKDLLPNQLRPEGVNPLNALHSVLSEGMHARSDAECLEDAESCRAILTFLVGQIAVQKQSAKEFTESMKTLLDKKALKK